MLQKLLEYENKIKKTKSDPECAHVLEDAAMSFFIENCHKCTKKEIVEAQAIFSRIEELDIEKWYS